LFYLRVIDERTILFFIAMQQCILSQLFTATTGALQIDKLSFLQGNFSSPLKMTNGADGASHGDFREYQ